MAFIIATDAGTFYNGKAGPAWVSANRLEAFTYASRAEAERSAALFNRMTPLHGLTFSVEVA